MATAAEIFAGLTRLFEGMRLRAYPCPAGVPTIGEGSTHYEDGTPVKLSDPPISLERAEALAARDRAAFLHEACKQSPALAQRVAAARRAAIADFIYNMGPARYRASTLRRKVNEANWPEARAQLAFWVWGGGRKLPGLVKRRTAEAALLPDD